MANKLWIKDNKLLLKDGKLLLADSCCCGEEPFDGWWCFPGANNCTQTSLTEPPEEGSACPSYPICDQSQVAVIISGAPLEAMNGIYYLNQQVSEWDNGDGSITRMCMPVWTGRLFGDASPSVGWGWGGTDCTVSVVLDETNSWITTLDMGSQLHALYTPPATSGCRVPADQYDNTLGPFTSPDPALFPADLAYLGVEQFRIGSSAAGFNSASALCDIQCVRPGESPPPSGVALTTYWHPSEVWGYNFRNADGCPAGQYRTWSAHVAGLNMSDITVEVMG